MTRVPDDIALGSEFPAASREQWLRLVDGVLKGAAFDRKLVTKSYDGVTIQPLYERANSMPIVARAPGTPWQVMQRIDHPDPATANAEALHDLQGGATALALISAHAIGSYNYGLEPSEPNVARALREIPLDQNVTIELDLDMRGGHATDAIVQGVKSRNIAPAGANIRFGLDPIGTMLASGQSQHPWDALASDLAQTVLDLASRGFKGPFVVADGRVVHNAGGSEVQELGYVLAVTVSYLRTLEAHAISLDDARRMIFFRLAADTDQFLNIAKFRALRKLWARVEEACGLVPRPMFISAETAWRMMTKRDPWVNMLRATIAVFSAGLGGANCISVLPYTLALGLPDRFARRVARNTQLVLLEESNLAKVTDPAAGSGGIEDLTRQLSSAAWALFQDFERLGLTTALEQGLIQNKVAATRAERQHAIAFRQDALIGTSAFPNINEAPVSVLDVASVPTRSIDPTATMIEPLPAIRLAEPFEQLRDLSDNLLATTGSRPRVFLANLGDVADFSARAMFAKNFFEAGGIEAVTNDGFATVSARLTEDANAVVTLDAKADSKTDLVALVSAFEASGAKLVCLCSSDEVYEREAAAAARELSRARALIYLAGRPKDLENALRAAGVQAFIYAGCDVVTTLEAGYRLIADGRST